MLSLPAHQWWFVRRRSAFVGISLADTNFHFFHFPHLCFSSTLLPLGLGLAQWQDARPSLRDHEQGQADHALSPKSHGLGDWVSEAFAEPWRICNQTSSGTSVTGRAASLYSHKRQNGGGSPKWTRGTKVLCYVQNAKPNTQRCPQRSQRSPRYPLPKPTHARMPGKGPRRLIIAHMAASRSGVWEQVRKIVFRTCLYSIPWYEVRCFLREVILDVPNTASTIRESRRDLRKCSCELGGYIWSLQTGKGRFYLSITSYRH